MKQELFKRTLLATMVLLSMHAAAQFTVNGHGVVLDQRSNTFLCCIPQSCFGSDYAATVTPVGSTWTSVSIDGNATGNITFADVEPGKKWTVQGIKWDGSTVDAQITFTFLPVISFTGTVDKIAYHVCKTTVLMPSHDITSDCKIKFRGSTTNSSAYNKRNFHLKFIDSEGKKRDMKFFDDLRNDNNWILDAGTLDRIRIRNRVLTDLWLDFANKPYYADKEPKALNASRGEMVEVVRNGIYQGVYNMCEAMDRKQMKLAKFEEDGPDGQPVIHGQMWKAANRSQTTKMNTVSDYDNSVDTWEMFEVKYPDLEDVSPTDFSLLHDLVDFVANSSNQDFDAHAAERMDLPVLQDYCIMLQLLMAYDNFGKNIYWSVYDREQGTMMTPSVWDFDTSLGQSWKREEYHPSYLTPDKDLFTLNAPNNSDHVDNFIKRLIALDVEGFNAKTSERYRQLRASGILTVDSIMARFDHYLNQLAASGAKEREYQRWYQTSDLGGRSVEFDEERAFIADWLTKRLDYLDKNIFNEHVTGDVNNDGKVDIKDVNLTINYLLGYPDDGGGIYAYRYDVARNLRVDVADLNEIINIILK